MVNSIENDSMIFLNYLWHSKHELSDNRTVKFTQNNFMNKNISKSQIKYSLKSSLDESSYFDQDYSDKEFNKIYGKINLISIIQLFDEKLKRNHIR